MRPTLRSADPLTYHLDQPVALIRRAEAQRPGHPFGLREHMPARPSGPRLLQRREHPLGQRVDIHLLGGDRNGPTVDHVVDQSSGSSRSQHVCGTVSPLGSCSPKLRGGRLPAGC